MRIGIHDGDFHASEALACVMLKTLPEYRYAEIVRSRDTRKLAACDVLVGVGDVYDPRRHLYDHHQASFNESLATLMPGRDARNSSRTKLSSAGLIYGRRVVEQLVGCGDQARVDAIYKKIYSYFIEEIDARDNGIEVAEGTPHYEMTTHLSYRVAELRPAWNRSNMTSDFDSGFKDAMELVKSEFEVKVKRFKDVLWPARQLVRAAMQSRTRLHSSGRMIEFRSAHDAMVPIADHVDDLEEELEIPSGHILFAILPYKNMYRVRGINLRKRQFEERLKLKREWWGLKDAGLVRRSGISAAMFVHANGFLGACRTKDGALEMAVRSVEDKYGRI